MYSFILENERGNQLAFNVGGPFTIDEIRGLAPAPATINTSEVALVDGQQYNSSKVQMRTLAVAFYIEQNPAQNRLVAYKVCRPKHRIRAYYKSETRDVYIDGYVQSVEVTHFDNPQVCTVTILCPQPYWRTAQAIVDEMSAVVPAFRFPFASPDSPEALVFGTIDPTASIDVANNGEVETGLVIELQAYGTITNPKVIDYETNEFIGVNYTMQAGDVITINTNAGQKGVTLLRNGVTTNIFNNLMQGITWLQLPFGGGVYAHEIASGLDGDLAINIIHDDLYDGV